MLVHPYGSITGPCYMLLGYIRISQSDGSQSLDLQRDALLAVGVAPDHVYEDCASGRQDARPGLEACLKVLRPEDTLVVWKLDRLGDGRAVVGVK